jgi:hypothetical protein
MSLTPDPYLLRGRCAYASSGCNGPKEAQCMGLCTHRVQPIDKPLAVEMPRDPIGRRQLAINTYSVYRKAGHGVRASLRQFFRVLARNS